MLGSKLFIWINSFCPHNNCLWSVFLCSAFPRWRNWGTQRSPAQDLIRGKQENCAASQSALGFFTLSWLDHVAMPLPAYGFHFHRISGFPEIRTEDYSFLYSQSLAQSRCSLNFKWSKIDSSCRDNRLWVGGPRALNWEGDFPGQSVTELDIISHGRDAARLGQSKDESSAEETSITGKKKPHTQKSSLGPSADAYCVDGLEVAPRNAVDGKHGCEHSDAKQSWEENLLEF